jgi:hypothetical protein
MLLVDPVVRVTVVPGADKLLPSRFARARINPSTEFEDHDALIKNRTFDKFPPFAETLPVVAEVPWYHVATFEVDEMRLIPMEFPFASTVP